MTQIENGGVGPQVKRTGVESVPAQPNATAEGLLVAGFDQGAPQTRGPRGSLLRIRSFVTAPTTRVWAPVVLKAVGAGALLCAVAFLGHLTRDTDRYGELVRQLPIQTESRATEPPGHEHDRREPRKAQPAAQEHQHVAHAPKQPAPQLPKCKEAQKKEPQGVLADGRIILNEATADEFTLLRGVGKTRAEAIIKLRDRLGRFRRVSDLLRIRGIGWKTLQKLKPRLVLERPQSPTPPDEVPQARLESSPNPKT